MINKIFFNEIKPPFFYINNKRLKRMVFNDEIVYEYIPCTGVSLPSSLNIDEEETYKLDAEVSPQDCTDIVIWSTSDNNIAEVSTSGLVTGVSYGTCNITATCGNFSDTCKVTVNELITLIPCEYVTVTPSSATLSVGDSVTITGSAYPSNTTDYMLVSSSDVSIIAIGSGSAGTETTKTITVTAKAQGSVTITFNCNGVKGYCHITVN